jgi:Ca-activated chloride channel family protein
MTSIEFLRPGVLWVGPLIALAFVVWRLRPVKRFVAFSAVGRLRELRHRPSLIRRLPALFIVLAIVCVLLALADPVVPYTESEITSRGLDIVLVLDLSSSMQETMGLLRPPRTMQHLTFSSRDAPARRAEGKTRLDTTKDALRDLVGRRRDDRIGLVVFSDHAYLISPLTFDTASLVQYINMVDAEILRGEGMTAIGDGLALANFLLARQSTSERRNKVIVVFTDGEYNFGRDPVDVLVESEAAGIRVHVIGVDLEEEVKSKAAVKRLIQTVRQYGGQYFNADTYKHLQAANAEIDRLEKGTLSSKVQLRNTSVIDWFTIPGLVFLGAAVALRAIPYFADFT